MRFDRFVDFALYDPDDGFYSQGVRAGRRGDFLTSVEVGPLFGAVLARALDTWWAELRHPDPFTIIEAGAGVGTLARSILAAEPSCLAALRYVAVERSEVVRAHHAGLAVESREDMPDQPFTGVVLANELLDNLAFRLVERGVDAWLEVEVDMKNGEGVERLVPAEASITARADALAPDAPVGSRLPLQEQAHTWVADVLRLVARGRVVVIDYAVARTAELTHRPFADWVRTYRDHGPGMAPHVAPGSQDITVEVVIDQLPIPNANRSQAEFLAEHGIAELVEEGRSIWIKRAHLGDLSALKGRSRIREAEALLEPGGLGDFRVVEWVV